MKDCLYIINNYYFPVVSNSTCITDQEYFKEIKTKTKAFNSTTDDKNITKTVRNIRMKLFKYCKVTIPTFIEKSEEKNKDVKENFDDKIPVT